MMDNKEAIEFIEDVKREYTVCPTRYQPIIKRYNSVINLLQQGEKYRQLVGELENCLLPEEWETVEILKQKYFPKE